MPILKNPQHELFAQELAKGAPYCLAYERAGYAKHSSNAKRLSENEDIKARVTEFLAKAVENTGITVERIARELAKIGFANLTDVVDWGDAIAVKKDDDSDEVLVQGVVIKPSVELSPEIASAICEIRKTKDGLSIKMHDKRAALVDLGRYLGMFVDKTEVTGKDGGAVKFEHVTDEDRVAALASFMARTGAALPMPKETEH